MKTLPLVRWLIVSVCAILLTSCASSKVNWGNRVGTYTYDQAVAELGAPDHVTMRDDGSIIADWHTRRSSRSGVSLGFGTFSGPIGVGAAAPISGSGSRSLRLTFGPDKILTGWDN